MKFCLVAAAKPVVFKSSSSCLKRDQSPATLIVLKSLVQIQFTKKMFLMLDSFFCAVGKDLADKTDPATNPLLACSYEINKYRAKFHFRAIKWQIISYAFAKFRAARVMGLAKSLTTAC